MVQVYLEVRDWNRDKLLLVRLILRSVVVSAVLSCDAGNADEDQQRDDCLRGFRIGKRWVNLYVRQSLGEKVSTGAVQDLQHDAFR